MLILSRKAGQRIVIGKDIIVSIMRVTRNQISIGIDAPESVHIVRGELTSFLDNQPVVSSSARQDVE